MAAMRDADAQRTLANEFETIRARYFELIKEMLDESGSLPDWVMSPAAACACGDRCSTGTTDMDRVSEKVLPVDVLKR